MRTAHVESTDRTAPASRAPWAPRVRRAAPRWAGRPVRGAATALAIGAVLTSAPLRAVADAPAGWSAGGPPGAAAPVPGGPAAPPWAVAPVADAPRYRSYAAHTLTIDAIALGVGVLALREAAESPLRAGVIGQLAFSTYMLGAPIAHVARGRYGAGLASLGLRVGLPYAGALLGAYVGPSTTTGDCDPAPGVSGDCVAGGISIPGLLVGAGVGLVAASLLDAKLLARVRVVERAQVAPTLSYQRGGTSVGLAGRF